MRVFLIVYFLCVLSACQNFSTKNKSAEDHSAMMNMYTKGSFGYDLAFLKQFHSDLLVLGKDSTGPQIIILPAYQGRVMTSTAEGAKGVSFGWVNHDLIASGKQTAHINVYGGEERLWLGPEGGQFSIYFKKGVDFSFDNWFVPKELDTEPFHLLSSTDTDAIFDKELHLVNYTGTAFDLSLLRKVKLLNRESILSALGTEDGNDIQMVAFESENLLTNKGKVAWTKQTGLLSIWVLSMLNASEQTTIAVPYRQGDSAQLGKIVTDDYFGKIPSDRLKVANGLILLKADANHRSKIGLSPQRAMPAIASYDAQNGVLTIAQYSLPKGVTEYVNSLWKIQDNPFAGDAINAYNDGPIDGKQLGRFFELESSSPAAALAPGQSIQHTHRTIHLKGSKESLNKISQRVLGVDIDAITL